MTAPIPTTEVVEALARAWAPRPDQAPQYVPIARQVLTAAYPQIVADVLNHYADQLDIADLTGDVDMYVTWLIQQASQVRP